MRNFQLNPLWLPSVELVSTNYNGWHWKNLKELSSPGFKWYPLISMAMKLSFVSFNKYFCLAISGRFVITILHHVAQAFWPRLLPFCGSVGWRLKTKGDGANRRCPRSIGQLQVGFCNRHRIWGVWIQQIELMTKTNYIIIYYYFNHKHSNF